MALKRPSFRVSYLGKNITADVVADLESMTFADRLGGESDELTITVADPAAKWLGPWYPKKGDQIEGWLGDTDGTIAAGTYEIDKITYEGNPGRLEIHGLAAGPKSGMRTARSAQYKGKTLRQLAEDVARRHGLTVTGTVPGISLGNITQDNESDIAFLAKVAEEYGFVFTIKTGQLVFMDVFELEAGGVIRTLKRSDLWTWRGSDSLIGVYAACEVKWHHPKEKKTIGHAVKASQANTSGDTLIKHIRAENAQQAERKAKAALHKENAKAKTIEVDGMEGDRRILAGVNVQADSTFGGMAGKYHVTSADHTVTRSGSYAVGFAAREV